MFMMRRRLIRASITSPVSIISCRVSFLRMMISAPVLWSDISRQASAISVTDLAFTDCMICFGKIFPRKERRSSVSPALRPSELRKRRISGWKMMIRAMAPTLIRVPSTEDIIFMPIEEAMM